MIPLSQPSHCIFHIALHAQWLSLCRHNNKSCSLPNKVLTNASRLDKGSLYIVSLVVLTTVRGIWRQQSYNK